MNTISDTDTDINRVSIAGQVVNPSYDPLQNKLTFTMENSNGRFSVEFHPCKSEIGITQGIKVWVIGYIYSLRSERYLLRIRAQVINKLGEEWIENCSN